MSNETRRGASPASAESGTPDRQLRLVLAEAPRARSPANRDEKSSFLRRTRRFADAHAWWFAALAVFGMLGFVAACSAVMVGAVGVVAHLELTAAALAAYGLGLGASYLGEPDAPDAPEPRQSLQVPRSSWKWLLKWKPSFFATSS